MIASDEVRAALARAIQRMEQDVKRANYVPEDHPILSPETVKILAEAVEHPTPFQLELPF